MKTASLPKSAHQYFWDINPQKADPQKHPEFVIERLLELGGTDAVKWLNQTFNKKQIINTVKTSRRLSAKAANFWALMYNIPREEIRCLRPSFQKRHKQLWPH